MFHTALNTTLPLDEPTPHLRLLSPPKRTPDPTKIRERNPSKSKAVFALDRALSLAIPELEVKLQRKLTKAALVVVAAGGQRTEPALEQGDVQWR
jgi:hypothetical protein